MAEEEYGNPGAGETLGNPNTPVGVKVFYRPTMGKLILRKPGVYRRSKKVLKINEQLEAVAGKPTAPATKCKGRPWKDFVKCLKKEMKALVRPVR